LGIEINASRPDMLAVLAPLNHAETAACVEAERGMSRALAGSCTVPLGAYAEIQNNTLNMTGFVASVDGQSMVKEQVSGHPNEAEELGQLLAKKLVDLGADKILASLEHH
jgi:hydroxymethylbilane synthase